MRWVTRNLTLLLLLPLSGCHSAEERAKRQLEAQQRQEAARAVTYLKTHYNAVIDWPQELAGKTFTIDVGPIFLRADHRPILFYAMLEDVRQENNGTFLYFLTIPTEGEPSGMRLILDCGGCDLQTLKKSADGIGDFAVAAQITSVAKALDAAENAPEYVLQGKFIDARYVGEYAMDKFLASQPDQKSSSQ
jgi:hypothetical protein